MGMGLPHPCGKLPPVLEGISQPVFTQGSSWQDFQFTDRHLRCRQSRFYTVRRGKASISRQDLDRVRIFLWR